ncbi:transposase family protein [Nocardia asiatica]|uniref:transposase family protein n=1 Tax=Nocardia asiatica TaxID=209252 RepID=UPI00278C3441|nr:transposase family protein [Nocardia asiatica]
MIEAVDSEGDGLVLRAAVAASTAQCQGCESVSARVHSLYQRTLADAAIAGRVVTVQLMVRRFFCSNSDCPAKTFAEQVAGLTAKWSRRTSRLTSMLVAIGLAMAGRAGARLAGRLGLPVSRDTLIRLVRRLPDPPNSPVAILGVDVKPDRSGLQLVRVFLRCCHAGLLPGPIGPCSEPSKEAGEPQAAAVGCHRPGRRGNSRISSLPGIFATATRAWSSRGYAVRAAHRTVRSFGDRLL